MFPKYIKYKLHDDITYFGKVLGIHYQSKVDPSVDIFKIEFIEYVPFHHFGEVSKIAFLYRRRCQKITEEEYNVAAVMNS